MVTTVFHLDLDGDRLDRNDYLDIITMFRDRAVPGVQAAWRAGAYKPVATIEGDLDLGWRLTNNISDSWMLNEGIDDLHLNGQKIDGRRSSMVGDVMEQDGVYYVVDRVGFKVIDLS